MRVEEADHPPCAAFAAAMEVLAKPWTGLLIVSLEGGPLRFSEIGQRVGPIGDRMLSLRLRELEERGLVERTVAPGPPVKVEYALTELGRGFRDVGSAVERWGRALLASAAETRTGPAESPRRVEAAEPAVSVTRRR
jgi:DNA-binding HxlR family transcriptional regulator